MHTFVTRHIYLLSYVFIKFMKESKQKFVKYSFRTEFIKQQKHSNQGSDLQILSVPNRKT